MSECLRPSGSNKIYCHDKDCQKCSVEVSNLKEISHLKSQLATMREALEEIQNLTNEYKLGNAREIAHDALKKCFGEKDE